MERTTTESRATEKPTEEKRRTYSPTGRRRRYFPSGSAAVPKLVPSTITVAPGIGNRESEAVIWPETAPHSCALVVDGHRTTAPSKTQRKVEEEKASQEERLFIGAKASRFMNRTGREKTPVNVSRKLRSNGSEIASDLNGDAEMNSTRRRSDRSSGVEQIPHVK